MFGEQRERARNQREQAIIELVAQGLTNRDIAEELGITEYVVKNYLRTIYDQLGLWNRVELALWHEARRQENRTTGGTATPAVRLGPSAVQAAETKKTRASRR
jgi:DNA-binding CsgD family transcriptional regulator